MNINYEKADKLLTVEITEEIDHHRSEKIRRQIDDEIERYVPKRVVFDFDKVTFMDSAGIGMLLREIQSSKDVRRKLRNDKCKIKYKKNF
ncbi:MAG: anti-sigma factor antagonist [Clostridia bacterium]|nr:anti-sigma factor antagonist [Clostridia bacterium]